MPAHKKYLYTIIEHTGKILAEKVSRTEAQKVAGIGNISATIYQRRQCSPDTPHRLYIALYDMEGNLVYMPEILPWPNPKAIKKPPSENTPSSVRERRDCIHHSGKECLALKETYCKIEAKPCRFYKPKREVQHHGHE